MDLKCLVMKYGKLCEEKGVILLNAPEFCKNDCKTDYKYNTWEFNCFCFTPTWTWSLGSVVRHSSSRTLEIVSPNQNMRENSRKMIGWTCVFRAESCVHWVLLAFRLIWRRWALAYSISRDCKNIGALAQMLTYSTGTGAQRSTWGDTPCWEWTKPVRILNWGETLRRTRHEITEICNYREVLTVTERIP